ncbi:MAG: hypothetical protein IPJ41_10210 [Phycisphaerales bacterium]|nr:hypothetical protein [Phycisphaerales bacterium]
MADRRTVRVCALALVTGLVASVASADLTPDVFTIKATVGGQQGSFVVTTDDGTFDGDGNFYWALNGSVNIESDNGDVLATLSHASVTILHDPVINMNFNVQATNQNTIFQVGSGLLSFPTIGNPQGIASAAVTVTDVNGNGASLSPDGSSLYTSRYNGDFPAGTLFANLLGSSLSSGAFQSAHASDEFPGGGNYANIGTPISSMSAAWTFSLSALDLASGTSTFAVVPAPASAALLGLAGLAARRRRR